ncbi:unnamed protein product [Arabidopsis lyrata]|nr:uncharacterized protein LOC9306048 [Arabidopsis lyrata subsp. lyrata]CAH8276035.1 unnamed protein product [Arabidopsis lyrata]|eukprot:XP_020875268.1 uncharacterized protein LOC9306048 [Arabidopsis lyrata subsp. lyrata]
MECNKEEARRAMYIAEKKISENDYDGAKKFVDKAQRLYPNLDGLKQVLMMVDVYVSASNREGGEADWYGILGVDPLADDEAVKKQYKKLALLLHPDKNMFNGAEGAFKLVLEAWCLLSDKAKRTAYDQKRKSDQVKQNKSGMQKPPPKPHEPDSSGKRENVTIFWTVCNRCETCFEYARKFYLNKTLPCQNCGQDFVATEINPEMVHGRQSIRLSSNFQFARKRASDASSSTSKSTSDASSTTSASDRAKDENQAQERRKSWFEEYREKLAAAVAAAARGNANSTTFEAERLFKKPMKNSTFEEERVSKNPKTSGDANSTHEAERLFKNLKTSGDAKLYS